MIEMEFVMPANAALRDYLLTRRSVGIAFLKEPGPDAAELEQILTIGTRVPDHGKITPWRLVVIEGAVQVGGQDPVGPGHLVYLAPGHDELPLAPVGPTRLLVLGGVPFESPILMWWNFVARTREEVDEATREWNAGSDRFGDPDSPLPRIPAPATPW